MISLVVNEQNYEFSGLTLQELVLELARDTQGIAIAVNQCVVPKSLWGQTNLVPADQVLIFESIAGG